ncbi:RmlC-like cupins superfamily protein [Rhynchospora pubera]|uniref:Germin-like protein n=1 Tax=Rhynchospora pubera TaxID=906938 RepID=A0AAV8BYQ8_9POAL|nr:RmlC-like cupins superfamily protein [Rhynchospora pubera]KAJ4810331.1 RmlC-like cupins superfamily protein [Rhynchospora pubera]
MAPSFLFLPLFALLVISPAFGSDPSQLQDFCVADNSSQVFVNGFVCKNPNVVTVNDFFFSGLDKAGNTNNKLGSSVTAVAVNNLPGLNTLGISLARLDFAPGGLVPPHYHPRATEILVVLEGTLYVGFVASTNNQLFTKVLNKGDVFVFPQGLIHFQYNQGWTNAVALSGLSSQNPGVVFVANAVFGANPPISDDVLAKAFQLDKKTIDWLQAQFTAAN